MSVRGRMAQWPVNWLYRLYEGLSDYGRSMGRPAGWLAVLTLLLGLAYGVFLERPADIGPGQFREDIASFTIGNVLPAVGGLNPARRDLYRRLFDDGGGIDIPFTIELLSIFQASGGIVLFFLLSLGIRDRFRIK
jgi:drug/metabolite transporter (DMT)-like permease